MAWTQDDLGKIDTAIASGVRRVKYSDGSEVEYASLDDMLRTRGLIDKAVNPTANPYRAFRGSPRSGY